MIPGEKCTQQLKPVKCNLYAFHARADLVLVGQGIDWKSSLKS